jgi:ATP-dependent helicase/nuclease subunit B
MSVAGPRDIAVTKRRSTLASDTGDDARVVVAAGAATRVAAAEAWLRARPADGEVLVVGSSLEACDDLVRRAALAAGALFGVARLTLGRLAGMLAAPALGAGKLVPAGGLTLDAVAARAVHRLAGEGALAYFAPVADRPGFPQAVARTLQEIRMAGIAHDALAALARVGSDLAALAAALEAELARAGLADRAAVFAAATDAVASSSLAGLPLLLLDVPIRTACEGALIAALARRAPAVLATVPAGDVRTLTHLDQALGRRAEGTPAPAGRGSLGALQTHLFEDTQPDDAPLDAGVAVHSWPGEARECVEIARRIRDEAARGVPYDRMAIFLHAAPDYRAHLEEALRRAAIPAFFATGTTMPDPSGRALLALLACKEEGLSARRFAEYVSLAQVPDPATGRARDDDPASVWVPPDHDLLPPAFGPTVDAAADAEREEPLCPDPEATPVVAGTVHAPWRWEQLLVDAAVIGGKERWVRRLDGLERELDLRRDALGAEDEARAERAAREIADLAHLKHFALPLIARLEALPAEACWGTWLGHLRALAGAALRSPASVLATLGELEPMATVGPVRLAEVQLVLARRLRDLTVPPRRRRYGAVMVAPAEAARGLTFDVVFVPGLAERLFPRKIVEDPILLDAGREALNAAARDRAGADGRARRAAAPPLLATQATRVAAERLALRLAVGAAERAVILSYPRLDIEQARPRVPSFYTLEALRAAEGALPGFDEIAARSRGSSEARVGWPAPVRSGDAIDDAEYDLALLRPLLDADPATTVGTARYLLGANPHLARALRARARRWLHRWTAADGLVDPDDLGRAALARHQLGARSYSPTALQHFAACPYRFFLQAIHRLKPREEPVAIEVIDPLTRGALFHDVQFAVLTELRGEDHLPVVPANRERALAVADAALDRIARDYEEKLAPAIARVWEDGIDGIRADLREWIRRQAEQPDGWVPHRFELSFGLADRERLYADPASVTDPVPVAGNLTLRGSIDLVERHPRGTLRATDHKTGKARAAEGVVVGGGEILQPVLYALACERLLSEPVEAGRLYYCAAAGGFEERVVPLDAASRGAAAEVAATIDRALQAGFLPAAPLPRACMFCDYRAVCGPYEEVRVKRKPADRLADLARLRSMP